MTWYKLKMNYKCRKCGYFKTVYKRVGGYTYKREIEIDYSSNIYIEVDWDTIVFKQSLDKRPSSSYTVFIDRWQNLEEERFQGFFSGTKEAATLIFTNLERTKDNQHDVLGSDAEFKLIQTKDDKLLEKLETVAHSALGPFRSALRVPLKWLGLAEAPPTFKVYVSKN